MLLIAPHPARDHEEDAMAETEAYRRGREIRRQLLGDAFVEQASRTVYTDPMMRTFIDTATETVFGTLWARPGLDLKTRTLVCVVSDAATARVEELALHLRMARRQGWTEEELTEVLLHLMGYVGAPLVREAFITAKKVFADIRGEKTE
jgi:4-carboxymuconolactone decarboxylase